MNIRHGAFRVFYETGQITSLDIAGDGLTTPGAFVQDHIASGLRSEIGQFLERHIEPFLVPDTQGSDRFRVSSRLRRKNHHEVRYLIVRDLYEFSIAEQVINHPRIRMIYRDQQGVIFSVFPESHDVASARAVDETVADDVKQIEQQATAPGTPVQTTEQDRGQNGDTTNTQ